jgi:F0F1-type ATP synthase membrane subunit b/b'
MRRSISIMLTMSMMVLGLSPVVFGQAPSAGDMQQKLDQEMANAKRSATESSSSARQAASDKKSEAEQKMSDMAAQHKSQAEGKMTEEIERAKRKAQGAGY